MSKKLSFERYHWFHGQVKAGTCPNAGHLAARFEISCKQAQRDVEFMRDRLAAPLAYDPIHRGYVYGSDGYELPPVWLKEEELVALCMAQRLSASVPDQEFKEALDRALRKFVALRSDGTSSAIDRICSKVSIKNVEYYRVRDFVFHTVAGALFRSRALRIVYRTPHKGEETKRVIQPLHLLCYMGNWHLIAFCSLRAEIRDFSLSRILDVEARSETVDVPHALPAVKEYIRKNFGIISGERTLEVSLRFRPDVAPWIAEQVWHDAQSATLGTDGSLHLRFPVSGFEEVSREILKYGAGVEVVSPKALREIVRNEIRNMAGIYR